MLSDSGTLSEESSILKFPGVLIRTSTERPEVLDKGTVIVGGITYNNLIQSVELAREMQNNNEPMIDAIDYKDTNVSTKVVKIIQSYKDIINRNTWRKMTMRIAIEKIIGLLKNQSSKESNVKIHRLAYITNSKFDGNNYIDRWCKIRNSHIGEYSYIGFGSDFNNVEVGRYCSISSDVKLLGKHPTHFLAHHRFLF